MTDINMDDAGVEQAQVSPIRAPAPQGLLATIREDVKENGGWDRPGARAVAAYRVAAWSIGIRNPLVRKVVRRISKSLLRYVRNAYGIELYATATIGRRFIIGHQNGIVLHEYAVIGDNVTVRQGVTMGLAGAETYWSTPDNAPHIGDNVDIGAYVVILGPVRIGDNVRIFPTALVMNDVPANSTVITGVGRAMPQKVEAAG